MHTPSGSSTPARRRSRAPRADGALVTARILRRDLDRRPLRRASATRASAQLQLRQFGGLASFAGRSPLSAATRTTCFCKRRLEGAGRRAGSRRRRGRLAARRAPRRPDRRHRGRERLGRHRAQRRRSRRRRAPAASARDQGARLDPAPEREDRARGRSTCPSSSAGSRSGPARCSTATTTASSFSTADRSSALVGSRCDASTLGPGRRPASIGGVTVAPHRGSPR